MSPSSAKRTISALLALAAAASIYILAVDNVLWEYSAGHAYALIGFLAVDLVIIGVVLTRLKAGATVAMIWGILQILALIGDAATGLGTEGVTPQVAARYLFLGGSSELLNPSGYTVTVLLILYVFIAVVGALGRRAKSKGQS